MQSFPHPPTSVAVRLLGVLLLTALLLQASVRPAAGAPPHEDRVILPTAAEVLAQPAAQVFSRRAIAPVPPTPISDLAWPVEAPITSGFGPRTHPISGVARLHAGLDIAAATGTPIRAAADGTVIQAGTRGGYGTTVELDHGAGLTTLYAHQSVLHVTEGQQVQVGEVIGEVGSTGASTGPHLHFETRLDTVPVDPRTHLPG